MCVFVCVCACSHLRARSSRLDYTHGTGSTGRHMTLHWSGLRFGIWGAAPSKSGSCNAKNKNTHQCKHVPCSPKPDSCFPCTHAHTHTHTHARANVTRPHRSGQNTVSSGYVSVQVNAMRSGARRVQLHRGTHNTLKNARLNSGKYFVSLAWLRDFSTRGALQSKDGRPADLAVSAVKTRIICPSSFGGNSGLAKKSFSK